MRNKTKPAPETKPLPVNRFAKALNEVTAALEATLNDQGRYMPATDLDHRTMIVAAAKGALNVTNEPLEMPKDKTAGLANFVRMIIDEIENENFREAHYLAVDLWNDIGSAYVVK